MAMTRPSATRARRQSENPHAQAGAGVQRRHRAKGELRPALIFKVSRPNINSSAEPYVESSPAGHYQESARGQIVGEVEVAEPHQALHVRLEPALTEVVARSNRVGFNVNVGRLVKLHPLALGFNAQASPSIGIHEACNAKHFTFAILHIRSRTGGAREDAQPALVTRGCSLSLRQACKPGGKSQDRDYANCVGSRPRAHSRDRLCISIIAPPFPKSRKHRRASLGRLAATGRSAL